MHFLGRKIWPKSKRVNPWFLTIFWPISNYRVKVKIWKFGRRNVVFYWIESFPAKILFYFWVRKIWPKCEGANPWSFKIFRPISNYWNKVKIWKFERNNFNAFFWVICGWGFLPFFKVEKFHQTVKGLALVFDDIPPNFKLSK